MNVFVQPHAGRVHSLLTLLIVRLYLEDTGNSRIISVNDLIKPEVDLENHGWR